MTRVHSHHPRRTRMGCSVCRTGPRLPRSRSSPCSHGWNATGDAEDQYAALSKLLSHYAHWQDPPTWASDRRTDPDLLSQHPEAGGFDDLQTARNLIFGFQEYARAELFIDRDLCARCESEPELSVRCHYGAWLHGLKLVTQVEQGAAPEAIEATIGDIEELLGAGFPHSEFLPVFRKPARTEHAREPLRHILTTMWADLAMQLKFWGFGGRETIQEIEELLASLGVPSLNDLP